MLFFALVSGVRVALEALKRARSRHCSRSRSTSQARHRGTRISTRTRLGNTMSPEACQTKSTIKRGFSQADAQRRNALSAPKRRDGTRRAIQALPVPPPRKRAQSQSPTRASERRDATSRRSRAQVAIVAPLDRSASAPWRGRNLRGHQLPPSRRARSLPDAVADARCEAEIAPL